MGLHTVAAAGHGGQVVVSTATAALVDGDLIDLEEHRLKHFSEPIGLFQCATTNGRVGG